jgi:hypothetical protein
MDPVLASHFDECSVEIVILGGLKSFSRESGHYEYLDSSQNADCALDSEMSRHLPNGETFQRQVSNERSASSEDTSQTFSSTFVFGESESSASERTSIEKCRRLSSLKCALKTPRSKACM